MRKFKIAILTESVSSHSGARAPVEIAKNLAKFGHEVEIFAKKGKHDLKLIRELTKFKVKTVLLDSPKTLMSRFLPNLELLGILKKQKPDLAILAAQLPYHLSAKLAQIKTVRIYMGTQFNANLEKKLPDEQINILDQLINFTSNLIIYLSEFISNWIAEEIVAISIYCAQELRRLYKKDADQVIYLGGDHLPSVPKALNSPGSHGLRLISVSRITPYKGFHHLLKAVELTETEKPVKLTIVGSIDKSKYLNYLKQKAPANVEILVNPNDLQLAKLYTQSDIYLTADSNLFFGFPIAEASFLKKPTIAFDFKAARELVKNKKTGILVKNTRQMAQAIEYLARNPKILNHYGQAAYRLAHQNFTWRKVSQKYAKFLKGA